MPPVTIDGTNGITTPMYSGAISANAVTPSVNMKNRIINGAMTFDQRNAGASVNLTGNGYLVDRWSYYVDQTSKATAQQSSTTATGFTNSLLITSSSAYSVLSGDQFIIQQAIEGFNTADLGWGTANAKTVTLSFWVRSSLTGTFGGSIVNSGQNRSYPFTYTISSANTFEYKTITIAGDTSGTWLTTNGIGIRVYFGIGVGTTNSGTAGAWAGTYYSSATGATSLVGTNGATLFLTGVQLEVGSTATSFDYRPYTTELQLCQRYLPVINLADSVGGFTSLVSGYAAGSTTFYFTFPYKVNVRTPATGISVTNPTTAFGVAWGGTSAVSAIVYSGSTYEIGTFYASVTGATLGNGGALYAITSSGKILFTGCEL